MSISTFLLQNKMNLKSIKHVNNLSSYAAPSATVQPNLDISPYFFKRSIEIEAAPEAAMENYNRR